MQRQSVPSVSSNCHNLVLTIEQAGESTLPRSLFVKLPMEALATRWFFSIISVWRLESYFFRHVAHTLPLRTPLTYATRCQGTRFYLVQENLREDPSVELFTNPDMLAGPSLALVYRCLDTFARLHACSLRTERAGTREPTAAALPSLFIAHHGIGVAHVEPLRTEPLYEEAARRDTRRRWCRPTSAP